MCQSRPVIPQAGYNRVQQAGLLTRSVRDAFPDGSPVALSVAAMLELTAAGTVRDFHPVPF